MSIPAYPLAWPTGWKRTPAPDRLSARFHKPRREIGYGTEKKYVAMRSLTINEGLSRVHAVLDKMKLGRHEVVVSTNLVLRNDGEPRLSQGEPEDPGVAVYWMDSRQRNMAMAIDLYDRVADNLAAIAATLEAIRSIERHGGAAILERAYTGFLALPAPSGGTRRSWRDVLDLHEKRATRDDVNRCYRALAALRHPDRGGTEALMSELNMARDAALQELSE